MTTSFVRQIALVASLVFCTSCDDPTRIVELPGSTDRSLVLFAILDPALSIQALAVETVDLVGGDPTQPPVPIDGVAAEVFVDGEMIARAEPDTMDPDAFATCTARYGARAWNTCIEIDLRPAPGATYTIKVTATERPTATASAIIPGDFEITSATAAGSPPGTAGLSAQWTRSEGAHRYIVAVRSDFNDCVDIGGCQGGWYAVVADTAIAATIPAGDLEHGSGQWSVDVYAVDRALHGYLTTGTGGDFFSIPPASNVSGGHGVVGAWTQRSHTLGF